MLLKMKKKENGVNYARRLLLNADAESREKSRKEDLIFLDSWLPRGSILRCALDAEIHMKRYEK